MVPHILHIIFFLFIVAWGIVAGYQLIINPLQQSKIAKYWLRVPCTIESSELKSEAGGDGYSTPRI